MQSSLWQDFSEILMQKNAHAFCISKNGIHDFQLFALENIYSKSTE